MDKRPVRDGAVAPRCRRYCPREVDVALLEPPDVPREAHRQRVVGNREQYARARDIGELSQRLRELRRGEKRRNPEDSGGAAM
jgi:hypothetical protein